MLQTPKAGEKYENLEPLTKSVLVELNMSVPAGEEYLPAAKAVHEFGEHLKPMVLVQKMQT